MCPVLNLQCQLTTNYFNLEFLSNFFFIISILLIYVYCCVFCYNRYFALCKSGDLFVYTENIYTRNLFTKSSRIFFFFMMKSCILHYLYMYSPWFVLVSGYACDISGRTGYPRKKNWSAGFYIPRIFNTQQSRRDLFEGFYTCTKLCREFFFYFTTKRWCTWILHCIKLKNPWLWRECSI